ncbi:chromosome replication initiation inhibitor protein [Bacillus cereus Rock3-28]|nr:chromosome replication initiation inhibitor protein [Bacillus cereus Rock3-28]
MRYKMLASADFANKWFSAGVNRDTLRKRQQLFLTIKI